MKKFQVEVNNSKLKSFTRTIRFQEAIYEKIEILSEASGVSFNHLVNQCLDYALSNLDSDNPIITTSNIKEEK